MIKGEIPRAVQQITETNRFFSVTKIVGEILKYRPETKVYAAYSEEKLFLKFTVQDRYVRSLETQHNGKIWEDSCVEIFFVPDMNKPNSYFNLEINCGGKALMRYNRVPRTDFVEVSVEDIKRLNIRHSLPEIVDPEITEPIEWEIELEIPFEMLKKYCEMELPGFGTLWKINFYKISRNSSNPHHISWAEMPLGKPDFHRPEFFNLIKFL
jgi:hypothetical protein